MVGMVGMVGMVPSVKATPTLAASAPRAAPVHLLRADLPPFGSTRVRRWPRRSNDDDVTRAKKSSPRMTDVTAGRARYEPTQGHGCGVEEGRGESRLVGLVEVRDVRIQVGRMVFLIARSTDTDRQRIVSMDLINGSCQRIVPKL